MVIELTIPVNTDGLCNVTGITHLAYRNGHARESCSADPHEQLPFGDTVVSNHVMINVTESQQLRHGKGPMVYDGTSLLPAKTCYTRI